MRPFQVKYGYHIPSEGTNSRIVCCGGCLRRWSSTVGAQDTGNVPLALDFGKAQSGIAASGARGGIDVRTRIDKGTDRSGLILVDCVHEGGPVIDTSTLIDVCAGFHEFGDFGCIACAGRGTKGWDGYAGVTAAKDEG